MQGLGATVQRLRKARGWSQAALASAAGITQQAISDAERHNQAGRDVLIAIARAFDMTVDSLLQEAGVLTSPNDETPTPIGGELARLWPVLDAADQAAVLHVVRRLAQGVRS